MASWGDRRETVFPVSLRPANESMVRARHGWAERLANPGLGRVITAGPPRVSSGNREIQPLYLRVVITLCSAGGRCLRPSHYLALHCKGARDWVAGRPMQRCVGRSTSYRAPSQMRLVLVAQGTNGYSISV